MITVLVPVGPSAGNKRWLNECLDSIVKQTYPAEEVLLVDDSGDPKLELLRDPTLSIGALAAPIEFAAER